MRKKYPYLEESYANNWKDNPYLENPYVYNLNEEQKKRHFLAQIDDFINQKQHIKITLLNWQEQPIKEIEGIIVSGSISKDGSSSVRRAASLSCNVSSETYNIDNLNMDFSLNKKVFIEIGIENQTNRYEEYPILWFPQGIFIINSFSANSSTSSAVNLNLNLKDKMCLLNGDIGGHLSSTVQFDMMTTQSSDGNIIEQKVLYYNIITELVNHFGGEDLNNIIIQDIPLRTKAVVQWNGTNPIYLTSETDDDTGYDNYQIYLEQPTFSSYSTYYQGDDIGYVYTDFVPTGEIVGAAGDSICSVLDKIKNELGNYEYFYDVYGIFHFREIKNYLNVTQSNIVIQEMSNPGRHINLEEGQFQLDGNDEIQYLIETTNEKTVYSFDDSKNITSITLTPNYENIKNDFIINGIRKSTNSDVQYSIRYHTVIDEKPYIIDYTQNGDPIYGEFENLIYYTYPEYYNGSVVAETNKLGKWVEYTITEEVIIEDDNSENESENEDTEENNTEPNNESDITNDLEDESSEDTNTETKLVKKLVLPEVGNMDSIYKIITDDGWEFYLWNGTGYVKLYRRVDDTTTADPWIYTSGTNSYKAQDWRTYLYCYGLEASVLGTDPGPYYEELAAYWPQEYDLFNQKFYSESEIDKSINYKTLTQGNFFFDIIDSKSSSLGGYSVNNIGRRTEVYTNDDINCLFAPEIPNIIILNKDNPQDNWSENTSITENQSISDLQSMLIKQREECNNNSQPWVQVSNDIYANLATGGYKNSAYEALRYELFSHTKYQKVVSITALPVFYLEPNSRVEISDKTTQTYGDFMVQNINLTLGPGANMSVNLNEVSERL